MQYRQLGSSDLEVSEIALGTWLTTGVGIEKETAIACIDRAFDLGINFIDTANAYGRGASESVIGEALKDRARDSYVLATKIYFPMSDADRGLSREQILKQIDASLERLQTDYVDLYQCHRYDEDTPLEETMTALTDIVKAGKVRTIGFSEWEPDQIRAALDMVPDFAKFVSSQPQYSLLWRRPEKAVIPLCKENGISQIVWSPLGQGVLTGKYDADSPPPEDSRAASDDMGGFMERLMKPEVIRGVDEIKPLVDEAGCTMAQFALAWVLREPNVASAIVGASRPEQLDDNAAASGLEIDPALFDEAEKIVAAIPRN
ncbi:MAG: aldo/keto reductase family protein [Pseudomonadota bacterium]